MTLRRTTRGITLLELAIAAVILALVIGLALSLFLRTNNTVGESLAITETALQANRAEKLIANELEGAQIKDPNGEAPLSPTAGAEGLFVFGDNDVPSGGFTAIRYRKPTGYDIGTATTTYGDWHELRFVYDDGENPASGDGDDQDNDGDGLIDEGRIELWVDTDGDAVADTRRRVVVNDVASAAETYGNGTFGVEPTFRFNTGTDDPSNQQFIKLDFATLHRLPNDGDIYAEGREVRQALRNQ